MPHLKSIYPCTLKSEITGQTSLSLCWRDRGLESEGTAQGHIVSRGQSGAFPECLGAPSLAPLASLGWPLHLPQRLLSPPEQPIDKTVTPRAILGSDRTAV